MTGSESGPSDGVSRRSVLAAGLAGAAASTSGCVDRVQSAAEPARSNRLSLTITTVPADDDREAVRIVGDLQERLEAVGADVSVDVRARGEFLERVLVGHDFDLFVAGLPAPTDPDDLYEALHSTYSNESGWQNPYGFTSLSFDDLLDAQRRTTGEERASVVARLLRRLSATKPFQPICVPEEHRLGRTDRFDGWGESHLGTRNGYLDLAPADGVTSLEALVTDDLATRRLHPVDPAFRGASTVVDLVYDSPATIRDGERVPWLARDWEWADGGLPPLDGGDVVAETNAGGHGDDPGYHAGSSRAGSATAFDTERTDGRVHPSDGERAGQDVTGDGFRSRAGQRWTVTLDLRPNCQFHDGEAVTAGDVAFTYRFLSDATLGRAPVPALSPRFRGWLSVVEDVRRLDDYRVALEVSATPAIAERALEVPILPAHRWREPIRRRLSAANSANDPVGWDHLDVSDDPPVGSGPYRVSTRSARDYRELVRFDDHFTKRPWVDHPAPPVETIRFTVDPGSATSVRQVAAGEADVTASRIQSRVVDEVPEGENLERFESDPQRLYLLGFNARRTPFSSTQLRRAVAQLIDRESLVESVFHGHARPVATPLDEEWVPEDLAWSGEDPVTPFPGTDGELDVDAAVAAFEAAGLRREDGRLLGG